MSFATPVFLWLFMPITLGTYWLLPARHRNIVLAVASLVFYAYGAKSSVFLLLASIAANYVAGIAIERADNARCRNAWLAGIVVVDIGVLAYWKYAGFLTRQVDDLAELLGDGSFPVLQVALPIGISFFTFHLLSYVIDVWRERSPALRRPLDFVTYIAMFPQLIAGPIVRYHEIAHQLEDVRARRIDDFAGFPRFTWGLAKKVLVADTIAPLAGAVFDQPAGNLTTTSVWIGVIAYTLQIYFDFSGYTDMAIGLARMFGFRFPENFARPYSALSITDFWRRWHMSLSQWFRDYVYVPLGGNRGSSRRTYLNLYAVFLLTGLWHGAAWTFVLWGLYHGTLLVYERRRPRLRDAHGLPPSELSHGREVFLRARAFVLVMVGWVLFRAPDLDHAFGVLKAMVIPSGFGLDLATDVALTRQRLVVLALASLVVFLPRNVVVGRVLDGGRDRLARVSRLTVCVVAAPLAAIIVAAGTFSPFLYYQF